MSVSQTQLRSVHVQTPVVILNSEDMERSILLVWILLMAASSKADPLETLGGVGACTCSDLTFHNGFEIVSTFLSLF